MDTTFKKNFIRVDITNSCDYILIEKKSFYRTTTFLTVTIEVIGGKIAIKGFQSQFFESSNHAFWGFIGGRAFNAASTDVGMNRAVEIDGVLFEIDRTIICNAAEVAATIAPPELITVGGARYRVLKVSKHQDGVGLEIDLKTDTQ
jgi:hypothetical protein